MLSFLSLLCCETRFQLLKLNNVDLLLRPLLAFHYRNHSLCLFHEAIVKIHAVEWNIRRRLQHCHQLMSDGVQITYAVMITPTPALYVLFQHVFKSSSRCLFQADINEHIGPHKPPASLILIYKKLCYRRRNARHATSVKMLLTVETSFTTNPQWS